MFQTFANIFGYLLNIIYGLVGNYGIAIILFTIVIKLILLPLSVKQQITMKKSAKIQSKLKVIQFKYKNDPEKLNREMISLYREEKMSPFSGCLSAIIQFILLISIFYMVRNPLTYMVKMDNEEINMYTQQLKDNGITVSQAYPEIDIIREKDFLKEKVSEEDNIDNNLDKININMQFLGLDLGKIPQQNLADWTVYIIPILYIISTFISMKLTTSMQNKKDKSDEVIDITGESENKEDDIVKDKEKENNEMDDALVQSNKMMSWMMPFMSVSISLVAPLGLALYWLINNILMISERLILDKLIKD